jgi:hypothetical protein
VISKHRQKKIFALVDEQFEKGKGLKGVDSKRYSGPQLETFSEFVIKEVIADISNKYDVDIEHSKDYIESDYEGCIRERLDQHIWVNGKLALLVEDRTWVDKPFYTLKRGVIRNIMISCESKLHDDVRFIICGLGFDYSDEIVTTCDLTFEYGDRVDTVNITGHNRSQKFGWYDRGYDKDAIMCYITLVYDAIESVCDEARYAA